MPNNRDGMGDKPLPNPPVMSRKPPPSSHHRDPNPRRLSRTGSLKQNSSQQSQPQLPPRNQGVIGERAYSYPNEERMLRKESDQVRSQSPGKIAAPRSEAEGHPAAATSKGEKNRNGEREYDVIVGDVERELEPLAAELVETRRLLHETQKRYDESTAELSSRHIVDPFRKGDDIIAREIDGLRSDIRQWSKNFQQLGQRSGLTQVFKNLVNPPDPEYTFFKIVTPHYRRYMNPDGKGRSLLIQSFIWRKLMEEVFEKLVWAGGPCEGVGAGRWCTTYRAFDDLLLISKTTATDDYSEIQHQHWRSLTARTYAKSTKIHKLCVERRIKDIRKKISIDLKTCTDDKNIFGDNEHNKGVDNLQSIVKAAVNLDQLLWQQKAMFQFQLQLPPRQNRKPLSFDSSWMTAAGYETTKSDEERLMREGVVPNMYCVPALLKYGTSEGNNYKEGVVISKAVVDV